MRRGVQALLVTASLAATGCTASQSDFKIRPIADEATKKYRPGSDLLADARAQLALGNPGLAIEGFRKALRQQPNAVEPYTGLAACYEAMGRYDVAQSNYERALALAPKDPVLLNSFASALERWGNRAQAAEVRSEIAELASASAVLDEAAPDPVATAPLAASVHAPAPPKPVAVAMANGRIVPAQKAGPVQPVIAIPRPELARAPVTVAPQRPASMARSRLVSDAVTVQEEAEIAIPKPVVGATPVTVAHQAPATMARSELVSEAVAVEPEAEIAIPKPVAGTAAVTLERQGPSDILQHPPAMASSVTVKLPPARPAASKPVVEPKPIVPAMAVVDVSSGPRLERLSLGEVALITVAQPIWKPEYVARTPQMATVRWVPLKSGPSAPNIVLLNAARHQGLAADSRKYLYAMGWRKIGIGDAPNIRDRTIVMYPAGRERTARSLAAQFGVATLVKSEGPSLVVLLGRDVASARG